MVILKLLSETSKTLKEVAWNATYISPKIENEIINIIAYDVLQKYFIDEIKEATFFTIVADKVESHQVEQPPLWIKFIDDKKNKYEVFLEFGKSTRVTGEAIVYQIMHI